MKKNSIIKKFLSFSIGSWIGIAISVLSTPILTRLFSPEEFAKASMFDLAINIILLITMLGTDQAFVRFFYEEKEEDRKYLLRNCLKISLLVWIIISVIIVIFNERFSILLFGIKSIDSVILVIITSLVFLFNRFASLQIRMEQRGKIYSLMEVTLKVSELVFMVLFFYLIGNRFEAINGGRAVSILLIALIGIFASKENWIFRGEKNQLENSNKKILNYGFPLVFTFLIMWIFQSSSRFAIKEYHSMYELGIFTGAYKIIGIFSIIQASFSIFWAPLAFEKYESDRNNFKFFENMFEIIFVLMILLGFCIVIFKDFIVLLLGNQYREATYLIPLLSFFPIMTTVSEISKIGISFSKKIKWFTINSTVVCLINIILNLALVPRYGVKGATLATAISYIALFYLNTLVSQKLYGAKYINNKVSVSIVLLFLYTLFSTYNKGLVTFFLGIIIALLHIFIHKIFLKNTYFKFRGINY